VTADAGPTLTNRSAFVPVAAVLIAVVALAWWQTIAEARGMCCMLDGLVHAGRAMPFDANPVRFTGMWAVMMAAMMLPGIISMAAGLSPSGGVAFGAGYLAVWVPTAVVAFAGLTALNEVSQPSAWIGRVGGVIVALAGAYQFTGWKHRLLASFESGEQRLNTVGSFGSGLSHGVRCVGCSWALMSVLLVVGVMNLAWMAAIGVICLAEKTFARRAAVATGVGYALVAVGLVILIDPRTLDAIALMG
jgi:predicted metal-binding membrane protein